MFAIAQQFPRKQKIIVVCEVQMAAKGRQHKAKDKRVQVLLLWQTRSQLVGSCDGPHHIRGSVCVGLYSSYLYVRKLDTPDFVGTFYYTKDQTIKTLDPS